jgi:hypothetical protein
LETKFEYQVSPDLAEAIAIEQFEVLLRLRRIRLRYLPLGMGCFLALLFLFLSSALNLGGASYAISRNFVKMGGSYFPFTEGLLSEPVGFVLGIGIGWLINHFVRSRLRAMAQAAYKKMGTERTVSWNPESLTFQSPVYKIKVHWEMIDRIEVGSAGVYGFSGRRAFFAIPKDAFPPNTTTDDLTRAWQSQKMHAPTNT